MQYDQITIETDYVAHNDTMRSWREFVHEPRVISKAKLERVRLFGRVLAFIFPDRYVRATNGVYRESATHGADRLIVRSHRGEGKVVVLDADRIVETLADSERREQVEKDAEKAARQVWNDYRVAKQAECVRVNTPAIEQLKEWAAERDMAISTSGTHGRICLVPSDKATKQREDHLRYAASALPKNTTVEVPIHLLLGLETPYVPHGDDEYERVKAEAEAARERVLAEG